MLYSHHQDLSRNIPSSDAGICIRMVFCGLEQIGLCVQQKNKVTTEEHNCKINKAAGQSVLMSLKPDKHMKPTASDAGVCCISDLTRCFFIYLFIFISGQKVRSNQPT